MKGVKIQIKKAKTENELQGILDLQQKYLRINLTEEEMQKLGFLTLEYDMDFLITMTAGNHHVIAKYGEEVIGYTLLMDRSSTHLMKEGAAMFSLVNAMSYKGELLDGINYVAVGQACVAQDFAGHGLLKRMYDFYKESYQHLYDLAMTDISAKNYRSLRGHEKAGFEVISRVLEPDAQELWDIVVWDWR